MKNIILFIFCLLLLAPKLKAQGTFTAASCLQPAVNAIINGPTHTAVNGDTINIPAGSCTWTSGITVPNGIGISIIGAGQGVTIITDQLSSGSMFNISPTFGNATSRLSSMTLLPFLPRSGYGSPISVSGTCTVSGCPNFRLDHVTATSAWGGIGISDDTFAIVANVFGVADHNTIGDVAPVGGNGVDFVNVGHGSWQGVGSWGDSSWASADTFGTNQAFYLENNTLNFALLTDTDIGASTGGGARLVCRFNIVNHISSGGGCGVHGTDTTERARGARQLEAYYNTGTCTNTAQGCPSFVGERSAVVRSFGNSFTNSGGGFMTGLASLNTQRRWRPDSTWAACDGLSPWDVNSGTVYDSGTITGVVTSGTNYVITDSTKAWVVNTWATNGSPHSFYDVTRNFPYEIGSNGLTTLTTQTTGSNFGVNVPAAGDSYQILRSTVCLDQPTRGAGLLVTANVPVLVSTGNPGSVVQVLDPTYEAADTLPGTANHTINSVTQSLILNRDFYAESVNQAAQTNATTPFNGTSGTGHGTLANRPTTCTQGVGYWDTSQGNWNQSGSGGQGELFVCTAPNTWTLNYTPYTMPHPLTVAVTSPIATFTPPSVNFGQVPAGLTSNPIPVTLQNTGTANLVVSTISLGSAVFSLINNTCGSPATITNTIPGTGFTLTPGASCTFQAIYQPAVPNFTNTATVFFSPGASNPDALSLTGNSTGPSAPSIINFAGNFTSSGTVRVK